MSKNPAPRVRTQNLYTIESDGQPVAQAMAISQAEAVRLYVESVQQPTMSARLSTPMEARTLAHLPLLQREPATVDTTLAAAGTAPAADHVVDAAEMAQEVAAAPKGEPAELVLLDASAPAVCDPVQIGETSSPSGLPAEFLDYLEGDEVAAAPTVIPAPAAAESDETPKPELKQQAEAAAQRRTHGGQPVALYRNPADGASWSGRGLKPRWLVEELEAGRAQDEFLISAA